MFGAHVGDVLARVNDSDVVVDIGGWGKPFNRADWVIDRMPYDTRGLYGHDGDEPERFSRATWIERDLCAREPFPFADKSVDFVVCSHTLEDVRDPLWVCSEITRIGRRGYLETPSRLEEQSYGVQGPWVGWGHHLWLVEMEQQRVVFTMKHHVMHGRSTDHFPAGFYDTLAPEERIEWLFWEDQFDVEEQAMSTPEDLDPYLADFVREELQRRGWRSDSAPPRGRLRSIAQRWR